MRADVVCQQILMLTTAMHWVMVLELSFILERLDWFLQFVFLSFFFLFSILFSIFLLPLCFFVSSSMSLLTLVDEHQSLSCFNSLLKWFCFQVGNLGAPVEEWTVGGTALTSLMDVERRHGLLLLHLSHCPYYPPIISVFLFFLNLTIWQESSSLW